MVNRFEIRQVLPFALVIADANVVDMRKACIGLTQAPIRGVVQRVNEWQTRQA